MALIDLHHVALKTDDLAATVRFYTEILGMRLVDRPGFDFPGAWLQMGETMVHIYAGDAALEKDGSFRRGGAAVDHLAFLARDYDKTKANFVARGVSYRENNIADFGLWQLFVEDPSGVLIELNFPVAGEPGDAKGPGDKVLLRTH